MKNGKRFLIPGITLVFITVILFAEAAVGGNKVHVKKRVEELDVLHEEIMEKISPIPENGIIHVTAEVLKTSEGNRIQVVDRTIKIPSQKPEPKKDESSTK